MESIKRENSFQKYWKYWICIHPAVSHIKHGALVPFILLTVVCIILIVSRPVMAQENSSGETLCILDFNRLGDDAGMDWLKHGFSDMMITTMNRLSPYQIIDREHLKEILQEHGLIISGLVDEEGAVQGAKLAKAEYLLLGNFAPTPEKIIVQVRLIQLADLKILSTAQWEGRPSDVLSAPKSLSKDLLAGIGKPFDQRSLKGLEVLIPKTIDVAESFYKGMEAFDDGNYPKSLGFYLDGTKEAGNFIRIYSEAIKMYYLLNQNEHAVVFANKIAERLKKDDLQHALRLYFMAGEKSINALKNNHLAIRYWKKIINLAKQYEQQTQEMAQTRKFLRKKILELNRTGKYKRVSSILSHQDLKYKIWSFGIDAQGKDMDRLGRYHKVLRDGRYVKEPIPYPSVFMWKTRAQLNLARILIKESRGHEALNFYEDILNDYAFINALPIKRRNEAHFWGREVELERLFMTMFHYKNTGELIRDPHHMVVLKTEGNRSVFTRDFKSLEPDHRARVWSRRKDGGHEYFDFAAPEGYQIDRVTVELKVKGISKIAFYLSDPKGWPPRYDFSKFMNRFTFFKGKSQETIDFPQGTEFFSSSVLWGPRWSQNPLENLRWKMTGADGRDDLAFLQMTFVLSPKQTVANQNSKRINLEADEKVIKYFAKNYGWDDGKVLRKETSTFYSGEPPRDVYALDWIAYSQNGEIHIIQRNHPKVKVALPITINTDEHEYDPALVRTHEGGYALFWTRGVSGKQNHIGYFYSTTKDLVHWDTPQRMNFEKPEDGVSIPRGSNTIERTFNIVPIPGRYLMLLEHGFVRYSGDLRHWAAPEKIFNYKGWGATLLKTKDDRIWVVATDFIDEEVDPNEPTDPGYGFYTTGDGKKYKKGEAIIASASVDGINWSPQIKLYVDRETSGLWAFPVSDSQIGIAVSYNNLFIKWAVSKTPDRFSVFDSPVKLLLNSPRINFFVRDKMVYCVRPVHDFVEEEGVVLLMSSREVYERLMK